MFDGLDDSQIRNLNTRIIFTDVPWRKKLSNKDANSNKGGENEEELFMDTINEYETALNEINNDSSLSDDDKV